MKKCFLFLAMMALLLMGASALAEDSSFPVVTLDGECLIDYTNWNDKSTYYPATLTYTDGATSFTQEIQIKPQGTTSLYAPKKNFTIQLAHGIEMAENWGAQTKYVLKADYIDPTRSCNVVSAKLAAEMNQAYGLFEGTPNHGVIDGFPVWVKINGEDAGIFNWTIPKDAWLFNMDAENPGHVVLGCEGWSKACTLQSAQIDYETDWTFEVGEPTDENKAAFERMVTFVSTADDATFVQDFDQYLNLDACLNYLCFLDIAYGSDNVAKNMLMVTYDGQVWYPALYDLDSLWGINYDGTLDMKENGQWPEKLRSTGNCLFYRMHHCFPEQIRARYQELREGILSKAHIMESFEAYVGSIPAEYRAKDQAMWNADGKRIRTLELMSGLMDAYMPVIDGIYQGKAAAPQSQTAAASVSGPQVRYVLDVNGVQYSYEDISALPVSVSVSYSLDGQPVSVEEVAGKTGRVGMALRVERKADAAQVYGVTALVSLKADQCANLAIAGGQYITALQDYVCTGTAWLGGSYNVYEMQLMMDAAGFDPAAYTVVLSPVYFDGGDGDALHALVAAAGELDVIVNEGVPLHEAMVKLHEYLVGMQNSVTAANAYVQDLAPAEGENQLAAAGSVMNGLVGDVLADVDAMLAAFECEVAPDAQAADKLQLLRDAAAAEGRTEDEKLQAEELAALAEKYLFVAGQLEKTQHHVGKVSEQLTLLADNLPELVSSYAYANDGLYAILYKISTLYQNLAAYYHAHSGNGGVDLTALGAGYEVIVYTN